MVIVLLPYCFIGGCRAANVLRATRKRRRGGLQKFCVVPALYEHGNADLLERPVRADASRVLQMRAPSDVDRKWTGEIAHDKIVVEEELEKRSGQPSWFQ